MSAHDSDRESREAYIDRIYERISNLVLHQTSRDFWLAINHDSFFESLSETDAALVEATKAFREGLIPRVQLNDAALAYKIRFEEQRQIFWQRTQTQQIRSEQHQRALAPQDPEPAEQQEPEDPYQLPLFAA